jgi:protease-4
MRVWLVVLTALVLGGCAVVRVNVAPEIGALEEQVVEGRGRAKIAVVDISGIITLAPLGLDRFSREPALVPRLREEVQRVLEDEAVVGVVARIDSPGGSVTASDILYHELRTLRERRKIPVVACILDRGLSGGYYAALAADEIVAHPTSVVGGVGVIAFKLTVAGLLEKWGVGLSTVKSGELKDFWSPLRAERPEERQIIQGITDRLHGRFLELLAQSRHLSAETQAVVATGRIFDAGEALELGLVDRLGYLDDAVARVRERAGVAEARVILYRRPSASAGSLYAGGAAPTLELTTAGQAAAELLAPAFRYQWLP